MNFEGDYRISNENKDSWSSMIHGMPIPLENGIEHSQDSWGGIGIVSDLNPTTEPRIIMGNGMVDSMDNWNTTTESTMYQRNGIVQNANHGNGIGDGKNLETAVTSKQHVNQISNPIPVEMQEKHSETENWRDLIGMYTNLLQENTFDTDGILENVNPTPVVVHNNGNQSWVASTTERNCHQKLNSIAYQNRASNQGASSLSYFDTTLTSMKGSQQTQRFTLNNLISDDYSQKDGFPVTGQYYNPSSPPRFKSVAAALSITNSFSFAPITPEKVNFPVEETRTLSKNGHESQTVSIKDAENLYNELLQTINDSPSSAISATEKENIVSEDKDEQEIGLDKTPNQKTPTRRKKHRPKVIREGKPKRTPKDPKNNSSNEIRVKRKYVRRKGVINSNGETPVERVKRKYVRRKGVDNLKSQQESKVDDVETPRKPVKQKLNFDLEDKVKVNEPVHETGITNLVSQTGPGPTNLQGTPQCMVELDERRGIKRQSFEQMGCNVNDMNSLLMYQKMLLGVANRGYHNRNNLSNVLLESQKKMKIESAFQDNSRQMKGVYANGSTMGLVNSNTGRINPCYKMMNVGGNRQFLPPMVARYYLQRQRVLSGMQTHTMRSTPYNQGSSYVVTTYAKLGNKQIVRPNSYNQKLNGLNEMLQQHRKTSINGYKQFPKLPRGRPKKQKPVDPVDDITNKLQSLHIYDGDKKQQSELVLYRGSEAIIPFQPIKKRTPRPKVDLDPESERLWNLLMGIEGNEGPETPDKDKEKWWENERRVFRGRADSFIARMHLVQGDRRFSRWKGSVVDSVIGVFLTQNVSDHLSSSAFISLAAKFPLKSTTTEKACCQQPLKSQEANDIIKCHEKMTSSEEEVILTQDSFDSSTIQTVDELRSSSGSNSEAEDVTTGFETSQQSNTPEKEECVIQKDQNVEDKGSVMDKKNFFENTVTEANSKEQKTSSKVKKLPKTGKGTKEEKEKREIDWDSLRKEALLNGEVKERRKDAMDSIDYEAVRRASVNEISDTIKERGMNNLLADRIKDFLNRLVRDHGSIDLEWLRDAPPDKAKDYLLSFRGLGLKSVECVRLLTLHHLAFPVDTNVGRIAVRLGWVPLQPLPESLQLHLLEMYPVLESIQKYIWPRLCKLDQLTLYELHYQMITFGKVFCTKSKPNCNACPMRSECRHFASAFASARLALPGPEEKRIVTSNAPVKPDSIPPVIITPMMPLPPTENESNKNTQTSVRNCEPIIEEPTTPEPEPNELSISDIEDQYYEDSDEIPSIKLNMEEFTTNLQNILQDSKELQGDDMSKALVALTPNAASIPTPKLKDVSRLRTEHLVYELPDSHQLLEGLDRREADDPSPYLLAIWTPGETANSVQPPERDCTAQQSGQLCDQTTCFSCNCIKEANSQVVRGTILIPCRTAMHGSFPLNGTYFQVNEMFADHASSMNPIDVPRAWIWNLPRRKVYFGTSVSTIFKGLTTEGIQYCFWKGFVCVRGFDRISRTPRPLMARLHFPASKLLAQKKKENK